MTKDPGSIPGSSTVTERTRTSVLVRFALLYQRILLRSSDIQPIEGVLPSMGL